jgi:RHS repeat-associated protein
VLAPDGSSRPSSLAGPGPIFGGMPLIDGTGLYLARRRILDPVHGVFLTPDPNGSTDSPNRYAYARQNPADFADPGGDIAVLALVGIMAVGAVAGGALDIVRQELRIAETGEGELDWTSVMTSAMFGAGLSVVLPLVPELGVALAGLGLISGLEEAVQGHYLTAAFDLTTSVLGAIGAARSPSFCSWELAARRTQFNLTLARSQLDLAELRLFRNMAAGKARTYVEPLFQRFKMKAKGASWIKNAVDSRTEVRTARAILDNPGRYTTRSLDVTTGVVTETPLPYDPRDLTWDGLVVDAEQFTDINAAPGTKAESKGNIDIGFPRFDMEVKNGAKIVEAEAKAKVANRRQHLPARAGLPYYIASHIPEETLNRWQQHPKAIPLDLKQAVKLGFDGHFLITPEMRTGPALWLQDALSPEALRFFVTPRVPGDEPADP